MNRVFILLILAIEFFAFAVDSSVSILQAKNITDTTLTVSWTAIPDAAQYRIYYDESALLDASTPNPLLDTEYIEGLTGNLTDLTPSTDYTLVVQGFTKEGTSLGKTIPLHARTYAPKPLMNINGSPIALDASTVEVSFTRSIDVVNTQFALKNLDTGKEVTLGPIKSSPEDMRIVHIPLTQAMQEGVQYELTFKNIPALDGSSLTADQKVPLKVVWSSLTPTASVDTNPFGEPAAPANAGLSPDDPAFDTTVRTEPVPIDHLPQTGPASLIFTALLGSALALLAQKKLSKRRA